MRAVVIKSRKAWIDRGATTPAAAATSRATTPAAHTGRQRQTQGTHRQPFYISADHAPTLSGVRETFVKPDRTDCPFPCKRISHTA